MVDLQFYRYFGTTKGGDNLFLHLNWVGTSVFRQIMLKAASAPASEPVALQRPSKRSCMINMRTGEGSENHTFDASSISSWITIRDVYHLKERLRL